MFSYLTHIECTGVRYPKIFHFKNELYLSGSKKYDQQGEITKYGAIIMKLNDNFQIEDDMGFIYFNEYPYLHDINKSGWIRDVTEKDGILYMNVEIKQNVDNKTFSLTNVLFSTANLKDFTLIKKYDVTDFIFKELTYNDDHYLFTSKIGKDHDNPDFFWGIYLFNIIKNGNSNRPAFDDIVDYDRDKGHILHNVEYDEQTEEYVMYFSIRHMVDKTIDESGFVYKIYVAKTKDLLNYYDTHEVQLIHKNVYNDKLPDKSKWHSYPHYFTDKNNEYIICNQDDYGKSSTPLVFKDNITPEMFVARQYSNLKPLLHTELMFASDKKYIYYNELVNKSGSRYEYIQKNGLDLHEYSSYAPSCTRILNVMKKLDITTNDSILDIGCGRGFALSLFHLFPFKTISGIEISETDIDICKHNLHNTLNVCDIKLILGDILTFNDYNSYNIFYIYNPFSFDMFNKVVSKLKIDDLIICKNIHEKEIESLNRHQFSFVFEEPGEDRNYIVFKKRHVL